MKLLEYYSYIYVLGQKRLYFRMCNGVFFNFDEVGLE